MACGVSKPGLIAGRSGRLSLLILFALAAPASARQAGDYPASLEAEALSAWLVARTNIVPDTVVSATPELVVALVGKTEPLNADGPLRLTLREEVIDAAYVSNVGGRSSLMAMEIQCETRRVRMEERRLYPGLNLGGVPQVTPPSSLWVRIPEGSIMDEVARAACRTDFDWPLRTASAPAPIIMAQAEPAPVVAAPPEPEPEPAPEPEPVVVEEAPEPVVEEPPPAEPVVEPEPEAPPPVNEDIEIPPLPTPEPITLEFGPPIELPPAAQPVEEAVEVTPAPEPEPLVIPEPVAAEPALEVEPPPVEVEAVLEDEAAEADSIVELEPEPVAAEPELPPVEPVAVEIAEAPEPAPPEPQPEIALEEPLPVAEPELPPVETVAVELTEAPEPAPPPVEEPAPVKIKTPPPPEAAPGPAPEPVEDEARAVEAAPQQVLKLTNPPPTSPVYAVQIGAYRTVERAEAAWEALTAERPILVEGLWFDTRPVFVDGRELLRGLIRDFASRDDAEAFCTAIAGTGYGCILRTLND